LTRIFELNHQYYLDIAQILGPEDPDSKYYDAKALSAKSFRCFYVASSYVYAQKWKEATLLFDRTLSHIQVAIQHHKNCKVPNQEDLSQLLALENRIVSAKCEVHAKAFYDETPNEQQPQQLAPTNLKLADFPPSYEAIRCKPLFFDLALTSIQFPD